MTLCLYLNQCWLKITTTSVRDQSLIEGPCTVITTSQPTLRYICRISQTLHFPFNLLCNVCFNTLRLRQDGRQFPDDISNAFSWMKIYQFRLRFHWCLFPRIQLTISQHWLKYWLGAAQATSHYLDQWRLVYRPIYASLCLNELMIHWKQRVTLRPTLSSLVAPGVVMKTSGAAVFFLQQNGFSLMWVMNKLPIT